MSLHHLAAHIQSQGRKGDTGLIHMSPGEIGALQKLAIAHGGSLTVNPVTGLPEANFMKDWLPSIVGGLAILAAPLTGGMSLMGAAALGGGLAFGTSMAVGNSFKKSLFTGLLTGAGGAATAGLGGLGAGVAGGVGSAARIGATEIGANALAGGASRMAPQILTDAAFEGAGSAGRVGASNLGNAAASAGLRSGLSFADTQGAQAASGLARAEAQNIASQNVGNILTQAPKPIPYSIPNPSSASLMATRQAANVPGGSFVPEAPQMFSNTAVPGNALTGPQNYANMSMGDRFAAQGKGIEKLFTQEGAAGEYLSANKGPLALAGIGAIGSKMSDPQPGLHPPPPQVSGYEGPYLPVERTTQFPTGPEPWTDTSEHQYFTDVNPYPGVTPYKPKSAAAGGLMGLTAGGSYDDEAGYDGYADGGEVGTRMATPDMTAIQNYVQSISPQQYTTPNALQNYISSIGKPQSSSGPQVPDFMRQLSTAPQQAPQVQAPIAGGERNYGFKPITVEQAPPVQYAPQPVNPPFAFMTGMANRGKPAAPVPIVDKYTPYRAQTIDATKPGGEKSTMQYTDLNKRTYNPETQQMEMPFAVGGLTSLARGGSYLDGPGDGLSDSIHATIGDRQPARLADGEFVISADVVSDIGGGSSKAGAKKLHAMMDRVRQSAHGTKKQVKKLNDRKVLVA